MKLVQISVFLENKKGRLYDVCALLGEHKINIRALTVAESEEFGILRVVVDKPEAAQKILKAQGFVSNFTDIIAVEVPDQPGGLAGILQVLNENNINVEYMYGFVEKFSEKALLVFRFEDHRKALAVLKKNKVGIVGDKEISSL